jgi:hypothetical protein
VLCIEDLQLFRNTLAVLKVGPGGSFKKWEEIIQPARPSIIGTHVAKPSPDKVRQKVK